MTIKATSNSSPLPGEEKLLLHFYLEKPGTGEAVGMDLFVIPGEKRAALVRRHYAFHRDEPRVERSEIDSVATAMDVAGALLKRFLDKGYEDLSHASGKEPPRRGAWKAGKPARHTSLRRGAK